MIDVMTRKLRAKFKINILKQDGGENARPLK